MIDPPDLEHERESAEKERWRETELSAKTTKHKKTTNERYIKLTVVLLTSKWMLYGPSSGTHLSCIRRKNGLDSRAVLFVLSPISPVELDEFDHSLQDALYDPAVDCYTSHWKQHRKRHRHSQASSYNPPPQLPHPSPFCLFWSCRRVLFLSSSSEWGKSTIIKQMEIPLQNGFQFIICEAVSPSKNSKPSTYRRTTYRKVSNTLDRARTIVIAMRKIGYDCVYQVEASTQGRYFPAYSVLMSTRPRNIYLEIYAN